ncbi:hypothetical protein Tco_0232365 [Tanacetum coccineum]
MILMSLRDRSKVHGRASTELKQDKKRGLLTKQSKARSLCTISKNERMSYKQEVKVDEEKQVIMYTHGRKKAEAEPAPPARDPRDVEMIERLQQRIQELELQQPRLDSPAEEAETEPNV